MLRFDSDYMEGCHPQILGRLERINLQKFSGYGTDEICESAKDKIRKACHCSRAEIFFLEGGTQTNATVLDGLLEKYQGVIAAKTGHIACHEAGAIEAGGHKVIELPSEKGKLQPAVLENYCATFFSDENNSHMIAPGAVYISQPTEYGTVYTKDELKQISKICSKYKQKLYVDGARLGYALASRNNDVTLKDLAKYTDAFYIGGTKVGALFGEAVVFPKPGIVPHFFTLIKQHGALMAKGWLLGVQFDELFTDDLYVKISKSAVTLAQKIEDAFRCKNYRIYTETTTNQKFIILDDAKLKKLKKSVSFSFWEKYDEYSTVVRFATSWATTEEQVNQLISLI